MRSAADGERAILIGFDMFRQLLTNNGGGVEFDADSRSMTYRGLVAA